MDSEARVRFSPEPASYPVILSEIGVREAQANNRRTPCTSPPPASKGILSKSVREYLSRSAVALANMGSFDSASGALHAADAPLRMTKRVALRALTPDHASSARRLPRSIAAPRADALPPSAPSPASSPRRPPPPATRTPVHRAPAASFLI